MKSLQSILLLFGVLFIQQASVAQVAINNSGSTPEPSAMLDISSTEKGFLIPRMTTAQRNGIVGPVNGLMVFDTDKQRFFYYNDSGSRWDSLANTQVNSLNDLIDAETSWNNILIGNVSQLGSLIGEGNTGTGYQAFVGLSGGRYNSAFGAYSQGRYSMYHGTNNTSVGYSSLAMTDGSDNTAIGSRSMHWDYFGEKNTAVGALSLGLSSEGEMNTALGYKTLYNNNEGDMNIAIGAYAMDSCETGYANIAIGLRSLYVADDPLYCIAIGDSALLNFSPDCCYDFGYNVAIGSKSMKSSITSFGNTALGFKTLLNDIDGTWNTAIGYQALMSDTSGFGNTACGNNSMSNSLSGNLNSAFGHCSLDTNDAGKENSAFGVFSMARNNGGSFNCAFGTYAMYRNKEGDANAAFGPNALHHNVSGNYNSALGNWAGPTSASGALENTTAIGNYASVTASNTIHIGNTSITEIAGMVGWSSYSDKRFKTGVQEDIPGLDFIMKLKPVSYHWDIKNLDSFLKVNITDEYPEMVSAREAQEMIKYSGFLAQEVELAANEIGYDFSGLVKPANENSIYSLRYAEFVVPLVKAVQEQQQIIEEQGEIIRQLKAEIEIIKSNL